MDSRGSGAIKLHSSDTDLNHLQSIERFKNRRVSNLSSAFSSDGQGLEPLKSRRVSAAASALSSRSNLSLPAQPNSQRTVYIKCHPQQGSRAQSQDQNQNQSYQSYYQEGGGQSRVHNLPTRGYQVQVTKETVKLGKY